MGGDKFAERWEFKYTQENMDGRAAGKVASAATQALFFLMSRNVCILSDGGR